MNPLGRLVYGKIMTKVRFEANRLFFGQSFNRGVYHPIYKQARKGFICFITLWLISEICALYCEQDKTASDGYSIIAAKLMQANSLLDFIKLIGYNN